MAAEIILLIDDAEHVRSAVAESLARAGAYVESVASCAQAVDFLLVFSPDWILVAERQAGEMLAWVARQERLRGVPVVICPELDLRVAEEERGVPHAA
jgi:DNA-binding response OmpR family regulator